MKKLYINSSKLITKLKDSFGEDADGFIKLALDYLFKKEDFNFTEMLINYSGDPFLSNLLSMQLKNEIKIFKNEVKSLIKNNEVITYRITKTGINFDVKNS